MPHCQCLYEIENNLPRTIHCFMACHDQHQILADREGRKTSQEWYEIIPEESKIKILDPDGWDRDNYDYSFNVELVTKNEFLQRLFSSTISGHIKFLENF